VVSFVSRDRFCIFDPHEAHLPGGLPGLQLRLGVQELKRYRAQLLPFEAAADVVGACVWPLDGAIFRLPLRTPELAERSQICRESHTFEELLLVLRELLGASHELLLFLQSVETIDIFARLPDGGAHRRIGGASLRTSTEASAARLRQERRLLAKSENRKGPAAILRASYAFLVHADLADDLDAGGQGHAQDTAWLVTSLSEPTAESDDAICASKACQTRASEAAVKDELPKRRTVAVALRLWPPAKDSPLVGSAFCFLPLSILTGLPAHISANFALTANRRDLWRRSDDRVASHGMRRAAWNEALLSGTLPRAYADVLELRVAAVLQTEADLPIATASCSTCIANFLPDGPWNERGRSCPAAELWASFPSDARTPFDSLPGQVVTELIARSSAVLWDEVKSKFVSSKAALLCAAPEFAKLVACPDFHSALHKLRVGGSGQRSIVEVPSSAAAVWEAAKGASWLSPQTLAIALRSADASGAGGGALGLERGEADALVRYFLRPEGAGPLTTLHGLRICPLIGGDLGRFEKAAGSGATLIWWAEDPELRHLLPESAFIDPSSETFRLLKPRIATAPLNIRLLNARALPELLPVIVPPAWQGMRQVKVSNGVVLIDDEDAAVVQAKAPLAVTASLASSMSGTPEVAQRRGGRNAKASRGGPQQTKRRGAPATKSAPRAAKPKLGKSAWAAYDVQECEDTWGDDWAEFDEDWDYDDQEEQTQKSVSCEEVIHKPCICITVQELEKVIRRCMLLWKIIEFAHEKGTNPLQLVTDIPCIPVESPAGYVGEDDSRPSLVSVREATDRAVLAVEDFNTRDRECLERCGALFIRPSSPFIAIRMAFLRKAQAKVDIPAGANPRLYYGLKALRMPVGIARPLRALISNFLQRGTMPKDMALIEPLPVFETQGGQFAVPLTPVAARIISPGEDWDEALFPQFGDYLVSWDGEAGDFLAKLGKDRGCPIGFLSSFAAPRVGLFEAGLCVKFLEAVASFGKAPWKQSGVPKGQQVLAQACAVAPLVVFPDGARKTCAELADPSDSALSQVLGGSPVFPPEQYRGVLAMSVMRQAGLRRLSSDAVFLQAAREIEGCSTSQCRERGAAILRYLGEQAEALKWPTKSYSALGRLRIFPTLDARAAHHLVLPLADARQTTGVAASTCVASLDGTCTLFKHASVVWTQALLLDPSVFNTWPCSLWRKFGCLKDPPPIEMVVANLVEVAARWAGADTTVDVALQQAIVGQHLDILRSLTRRCHSTQMMAQSMLSACAFLVLDDGRFTRPLDVFSELHSGGDSDDEIDSTDLEEGESEDIRRTDEPEVLPGLVATSSNTAKDRKSATPETGAPAGERSKAKSAKGAQDNPWLLPLYLRPFRRLLLSIAGPCVARKKTAPSIQVGKPPNADLVPSFLKSSLNRPELADVEFILRPEGGIEQKVFAHRLILASACTHFYKTFTSGCAEAVGFSPLAKMMMPEWVTPLALLWMLAYLYEGFDPAAALESASRLEADMRRNGASGSCGSGPTTSSAAVSTNRPNLGGKQRSWRIAHLECGEELCTLLRLSEFYGIEHLKAWCEQRLQTQLSADNLVALSTHAFFCNARQLLRVCVYHMQVMYSELVGNEDWETLEPAIKELVLVGMGDESGPNVDGSATSLA